MDGIRVAWLREKGGWYNRQERIGEEREDRKRDSRQEERRGDRLKERRRGRRGGETGVEGRLWGYGRSCEGIWMLKSHKYRKGCN